MLLLLKFKLRVTQESVIDNLHDLDNTSVNNNQIRGYTKLSLK